MNDKSKPNASGRDAGADPTDHMALMSDMLTTQARSLDAMFTQLAGRVTEISLIHRDTHKPMSALPARHSRTAGRRSRPWPGSIA
jgi:hypothetical protein